MSKVAVAMSGGVDSSVSAALAVEKYGVENVFGLTMKLFCYGEKENDAASVCKQLGIPHYVVNLEKEFEEDVIADFISEYEHGRTPNPCVRCNSLIKFGRLLAKAQGMGAELLVTGHYTRIDYSSNDNRYEKSGRNSSQQVSNNTIYHLHKGADPVKDQSYFLYNLNQDQLAHIWFPLGKLTKIETRKLAEKYRLKTAGKTESQDICFVPTTTQEFLSGKVHAKSGNVVSKSGKVLGTHEGLPFYTVGQRKGLGGGFTQPMYVIGLDVNKNELIIGREEDLYADRMVVRDMSWTNEKPNYPIELDVKIRYNSEPSRAKLTEDVDGLQIKFQKTQRGITPGQTAVFYCDNEVIGGGLIVESR